MNKKIAKSTLIALCAMYLCACTKDYQKLAIEFERDLPDSVQVLVEQINNIDHLIYYVKANELYRHDLDKNTDEIVKPQLDEDDDVYGIYVGKENIAFLSFADIWMNTRFQVYNLKTQKFKDITKFAGTYYNDVIIEQKDSTISGYRLANVESYTRVYYDYDGNIAREEEEDDPNLGDFDVPSQPTYYQQPVQRQEPLQEFVCKNCGKRIYATSKSEASSKAGSCTYTVHHDDRISTSSGSTYRYTGGSHSWY